MADQYLIGLGPPRSGTTSLAALLDGCDNTNVTHEEAPCLPWQAGEDALDRASGWLTVRSGERVGDVGYYWLPYVLPLYRRFAPNVRFIGLIREREAWQESFEERIDPKVLKDDLTKSRRQFPTYEGTKAERRRRYYQTYVRRLRALQEDVPLVVHPTDALSAPRRILRRCIPRKDWNATAHHKNRRHG